MGGFVKGTYVCTQSRMSCPNGIGSCQTTCIAGYYPLGAGSFGVLGLTGTTYSCADNTVGMDISKYIRPDTGTAFTGTLCVKTDTYQ